MKLSNIINGENIDIIIPEILERIHSDGPVVAEDFEKLALLKKFHPEKFKKYESRLMYLMGLFYKTRTPKNLIEEIYSIYSDSINAETKVRFTPVQANIFKKIRDKKYFSFSAPTSSGKSFLFRELIKGADSDIVIVIPSRALIAEYIYTIRKLLDGDNSILILQFIENVNILKTKRRIYVITPERGVDLFKMANELNIGLFLFDEAQLSEEPVRGMRFDSFVRRVDKKFPSAKKVFAHPFVDNPEAQLKKHKFLKMADAAQYSQNVVGKIYISSEESGYKYFSPFNYKINEKVELESDIVEDILKNNGTLLVYISKEKIYNGEHINNFAKYIDLCDTVNNPEAIELIEELRDFIGSSKSGDKHSDMMEMMERGVVIHHGSMPLRARLIIEKFVNKNFAKICFATSTLTQGINMPFDIVWIDNFLFSGTEDRKSLDVKNLIGRSGRITRNKNHFDYGYVIVNEKNVRKFSNRIKNKILLRETSLLDENIDKVSEDLKDIVEAIKNNTFDDELHLTKSQVERLEKADTDQDVKLILDNFLKDNTPIKGRDYHNIKKSIRKKIKESFRNIYISHLRRPELKSGEMSVLSTSIPILLWRAQGKSFREIVSLRHAYLTNKDKQMQIGSRLKKMEITKSEADQEINDINIQYSNIAHQLPDIGAPKKSLFPANTSISEFNYDKLVYDTYDYLDKVISLCLSDPLTAAFKKYYSKTGDERAIVLGNYIKYGTNNETEIWLSKYGFGFEEIEWIIPYIKSIDKNQIVFTDRIGELSPQKMEIIKRYL
ncbi:MAG: DEAD/DEAH box helicase [Massilibacteroides sp.]|nr:DEAD/DEAH box helicase [Massilibacteroides sp.]